MATAIKREPIGTGESLTVKDKLTLPFAIYGSALFISMIVNPIAPFLIFLASFFVLNLAYVGFFKDPRRKEKKHFLLAVYHLIFGLPAPMLAYAFATKYVL